MSTFFDRGTIHTEAGLQGFVDAIPYANFIGVGVRKVGGELTCVLPFKDDNVGNPMLPALHGGVVSALLETSAILQLIDEVDPEHLPKPINVNIDYLRSAKPVETFARAFITKQGRRVANVRAEAWQVDRARPVAALHGHFLLAPREISDG
jgi:acyl-coenzyme A thioesterase PaaI-like protein